ncbi:helix-turn-helix transcriptional regulator [Arthrobacter sp. Hz1]
MLTPAVLTPQETADLLSTNVATLAQLRYAGGGPRYIKLGRSVRYRSSDIEDYLRGNTYERTDRQVVQK